MSRWWLLSVLLVLEHLAGLGMAGLSSQGCTTSPSPMDQYNAVSQGQTFTMTCQFTGDPVDFCSWIHYDTDIEQPSDTDQKINCDVAKGSSQPSGPSCQSRFTGNTNDQSCSLTVGQSNPMDAGEWKMTAVAISGVSTQTSTATNTFTVYTYNASRVEMQDNEMNVANSFRTSYNWNDREEDWEDGKGGYETVKFYCMEYGGSPLPVFNWYIGSNRNGNPIGGSNDNVFKVLDPQNRHGSPVRNYGKNGIIKDMRTFIEFTVNQDLLQYLQQENIDTNPEYGPFTFDLTCEVDQSGTNGGGGGTANQYATVSITVDKSYDNGALKSSTIGIIVGVVCAVILLVIALGLLLFARSRNMWCFDDYSDANDPRSRPQQGGVPVAGQPTQQRQYRR